MNAGSIDPHKSTIGGMDANLLALIAYIASAAVGFIPLLRYLAWLAPLVIFFMEKESGFVKFHAMQSFVLNLIGAAFGLSLIHISEPTRLLSISYAVFCLKKKMQTFITEFN